MFAKYDMDGDRVLDQSEQKNMSRELMGAKVTRNPNLFDLTMTDISTYRLLSMGNYELLGQERLSPVSPISKTIEL